MLLTGPGSGRAALQLAVDLAEVPADAVQRPVDVGAGQLPRLADLPGQQQRERVAAPRRSPSTAACTRRLALVEVDAGPRVVLAVGVHDGRGRLVVGDPRRALDRRAVDRRDVVAGDARALPVAAVQVEDAVGVEGLRRGGARPGVDLVPRRAGLDLQRHDRLHLSWGLSEARSVPETATRLTTPGPTTWDGCVPDRRQNRTLVKVPTWRKPTRSYARRAAVLKSLT